MPGVPPPGAPQDLARDFPRTPVRIGVLRIRVPLYRYRSSATGSAPSEAAPRRLKPYPDATIPRRTDPLSARSGSGGGGPAPAPNVQLLGVHEVSAAVGLPALLGRLRAERFLLAVADRLDVRRVDAALDQGGLHRVGAAVAQRQVVFGRSPLVAVSLNGEAHVGMLLQEVDIALHRRLLVWTDVRLVEVKEHILHILREQLFF